MTIPKTAKRVFKGLIYDVYHWQQKMFDGSFKTFEKIRRPGTVVVIPTIGKKILLQKQKQPDTDWFYDFPSGRMDKPGESPRQAALRELMEETGYQPTELKLWKIYRPGGKIVQKVYFFIARDCYSVRRQTLDGGEKIKILFKTFDEILRVTDEKSCYFGPLMIDVLLARIHKENYRYLRQAILGKWTKPPTAPIYGPKTNW